MRLVQWEWYGVHVCACVRACVDVRARVGSCAYAKHRQPTSRFPIIFFSLIPCLYALNLAFTLADAIVLLFVLMFSSVFWLSELLPLLLLLQFAVVVCPYHHHSLLLRSHLPCTPFLSSEPPFLSFPFRSFHLSFPFLSFHLSFPYLPDPPLELNP